jgi:hypothetical protein
LLLWRPVSGHCLRGSSTKVSDGMLQCKLGCVALDGPVLP